MLNKVPMKLPEPCFRWGSAWMSPDYNANFVLVEAPTSYENAPLQFPSRRRIA